MEADEPTVPGARPTLRQLRLRYAGVCIVCGTRLDKGSEALYDPDTRTVRCIECRSGHAPLVASSGTAGASAHREYERRRQAREVRVKAMLGNMIGGFVLALTGEPQSTWAWERGSIGEQKLAAALSAIADVIVLNDRRVRGTKGNIDHIVVAPAGVFVVDAKNYDGLIQTGYRGGLFSRDERLYVGGRDCSQLAANMAWQAKAVRDVLSSVHRTETIAVRAVLCFVDCEWPLVGSPESYKGVYLESPQSITNLIAGPGPVGTDLMARINRTLSIAFPSK